jgi:hypothetical protein
MQLECKSSEHIIKETSKTKQQSSDIFMTTY